LTSGYKCRYCPGSLFHVKVEPVAVVPADSQLRRAVEQFEAASAGAAVSDSSARPGRKRRALLRVKNRGMRNPRLVTS
jgi:hypothetical protein